MSSVAARQPAGTIGAWFRGVASSWDRFLFTPSDPATLGMIRILAGAMLLYTHLVWSFDLVGFFGASAWLSTEFVYGFHDSPFGWSHLYWIQHPAALWTAHLLALLVFTSLMVGFKSRVSAILAFLLTVSYAHRATGALFGLDQINGFLAMYLAVGPSGDAYSFDNWLRRRKSLPTPGPSISANVAIRLMQLHLCVVYLFAGLGKLLGESWWDGTALWGAFANHEYQTLDMTWMAQSLVVVNIITHVTLIWEVSYAALIWNKTARPIMLFLAIPLHLGIALCMGMVTFGVIMLVANAAFLSPQLVRSCMGRFSERRASAAAVPAPKIATPRRPTKRSRNHVG